ncbi:MAG: replicative DNA helicase [Nitrospirae bacterium]|nr:replicative DNA helicase [Nitrospirota bacterium]
MKTEDKAPDKVQPQNVEAEMFVLGAIMLDNEAIYKVLDLITSADFYKDEHRRIFSAIITLLDKTEPVDYVTVSNYLRNKKEMELAGGESYLSLLLNSVPTAANIVYHAKILREKALMRNLIRASTDIISRVYTHDGEVDELVDYAEKSVFEIAEFRIKPSFSSFNEVLKDSMSMIEKLHDRKETITGLPSGFKDLDDLTTGFQPGDLIIIGGRPSMGKTAFCLNIAQHVGISVKEPVAIFSLEMSKKQLAVRMLCAEAMVDANRIRKARMEKSDWPKLTAAAGRLADAPIFIDDSSDIGALEMRSKARRLKKERGLGLVVVDYLQLMRGRSGVDRREQEISEISRSLKGLAKELDLPVIALSQLNRLVEQRRPPIPTLADLRESGAIEQDADVILFLYREEVYNRNDEAVKGKVELHIAKQRNGPAGVHVNLSFLAAYTKFANNTEGFYEETDETF